MALITEDKYINCWLCGSQMLELHSPLVEGLRIIEGLYGCSNEKKCYANHKANFEIECGYTSSDKKIRAITLDSNHNGNHTELSLLLNDNRLVKTQRPHGSLSADVLFDISVDAENFPKDKLLKIFNDNVLEPFV